MGRKPQLKAEEISKRELEGREFKSQINCTFEYLEREQSLELWREAIVPQFREGRDEAIGPEVASVGYVERGEEGEVGGLRVTVAGRASG